MLRFKRLTLSMLFVFTRPKHMRIPSLFNEVHIALSFVFVVLY